MNVKIAVLCGGTSPEREVSLVSGRSVFESLKRTGYDCKMYDLDIEFFKDAINGGFDVVFIALHGCPGEDGTVQGMLDVLGIPYTGSGVLASALAMSKHLSKTIFRAKGLKVAEYVHVCMKGKHGTNDIDLKKASKKIGLPAVIKPSNLGSSVGVSIVSEENEIDNAISLVLEHDCCVMMEKYIHGREIQCGIVGREKLRPLPLIEIVPKKKFFDYEAKYTPGLAKEITPAPLPEELSKKGTEVALRAFRALGCRDVGRVDMFLVDDKEFLISELNTIPGLTPVSLIPKEAEAAGMSYDELVMEILKPALEELEEKCSPGSQ